jgi:tetratricopeptide (TPR) repeat protein
MENSVVYLERCVQTDPQSYQALIMLARSIAMRTRDTDLDKEEKLTAAEKYANQASETLKTALKPNVNLPDAQWEAGKKDMNSQIYETLGVAAFVRGKNDEAIAQLKKSIDTAANPDPSTMVRLANIYSKTGKLDDGIAVIDKALAMPDLNATVKQIAQAQKDELVKKKSGAQANP